MDVKQYALGSPNSWTYDVNRLRGNEEFCFKRIPSKFFWMILLIPYPTKRNWVKKIFKNVHDKEIKIIWNLWWIRIKNEKNKIDWESEENKIKKKQDN
jgi:hypothetical protein